MSHPHIEIKSTDCWNVSIKINDQEIPGVRSYSFSQTSGEFPVLSLEIVAGELTFDGDGTIHKTAAKG